MREPLHRFADIHYGKSPTEVLTMDSEIPIFGTGGRYGSATRPLFNGPAVIVARKGSLGNPHLALTPFWASDTTYAVVPKSEVDVRWLYYSLSLFDLTKLNEATGVPSINRDWLRRIELESATPDQQRQIAEILGTVDEVIEQTKALIAKQQQVKAGLMHDLFTRGVTATGTLRPPAAEAPHLYQDSPLGPIPREWIVRELAEFYANPIRDFGSFASTNLITFTETGIPFIKSEMIGVEEIIWDSVMYITHQVHQALSKSHVNEGIILFSKIGSALGKAVIYDGSRGACNSNAAVAKIDIAPKIGSAEFVMHYLNHDFARSQFRQIIVSLLPRINLGDISRLLIPSPLVEEQRQIADLINSASDKIRAEAAHLAKLRQEKQGLMQDLLTGRVPVPA